MSKFDTCPECGAEALRPSEGCALCTNCGFSPCA